MLFAHAPAPVVRGVRKKLIMPDGSQDHGMHLMCVSIGCVRIVTIMHGLHIWDVQNRWVLFMHRFNK